MIYTSATVVSVRGAGRRRTALVDVRADTVCARCAAGRGCGAGLFGRPETLRRIEVSVPEYAGIRKGDTVELAMQPGDLLTASMIVYGWPLAGAAFGALLAWQIGGGDAVTALAALAGLGTGVWLARRRVRDAGCMQRFTPRIIA